MKVGFILDRWEPARGGAERAIAKLIGHLAVKGDSTAVFCLRAEPGAPGGEVVVVPRPRRLRGGMEEAFGERALRAARDRGCDVVVAVRHIAECDVYWPHGGLHAATLAAGEASRGGLSGRVSQALHRISPKHQTFLELEDRVLSAGGARVVWCVSDLVRREIAAAHPTCPARIEVHPNGVSLDDFRPALRRRRGEVLARLGADPSAPVLLFLGGNWRLKGWDVLRRALRGVPGPWTLIAAGSGADRMRPLFPRTDGRRVLLLPPQPAQDLYAAADVLVQPTWRDPCSLATLEALASGVPVVTTDANGASDAISGAESGHVVAAGDTAAFAAGVRELLRWCAVGAARDTDLAFAARKAAESRGDGPWLDGLAKSLARAATS